MALRILDDTIFLFTLFCIAFVVVSAVVLHEQFGTHRLLMHVSTITLTIPYCLLLKRDRVGHPLHVLGLQWPSYSPWIWRLIVLGILSGFLRFAFYRLTGLGGLALYESNFLSFLNGTSVAALLVRHAVFMLSVYVAVLIPGLLFCGIIQETFQRRGLKLWGLLSQALTFGLVHCYMLGTWSLWYGFEAFAGALIYGLAYHALHNLYMPALFMSVNIYVVTFCLRL